MKLLRLLFVLLSPMLFFACSKEKSLERGNENTNSEWSFTEGSNNFHGTVDTAYISQLGPGINALLLEGTSDDGTGLLTLGVIGINTSAPGVYKSPNVLFDYSKSTGTLYENDITAVGQFTIEVTSIDSANIVGTFTGQVKDSTGGNKIITSGKFSAKLRSAVQQPANGQLMFWAKNSCGAGGDINVKLSNNQTGTISTYVATVPTCGAAGTASFNVPAGTYDWVAKCGTDSVGGSLTVAANQCVRQEVIFGATPANGQVSFWAKTSCAPNVNVNISINNQSGTITTLTAAAPANCNTAGNANFTLPAGTYAWKATCGSDSLAGNVTVTANQCAKVEASFTSSGTAAQYSFVQSGGNCTAPQVNGTYTAGQPLTGTNTVVLQVNVTTPGTYSMSTPMMNGFSFAGSGTFTTTGVQNVTLQGTGTPSASGTSLFSVTGSASNCGFGVLVQSGSGGTLNTWSFTEGTKNFGGPVVDALWDTAYGGASTGKVLDVWGLVPSADTAFNLYIHFPASATQPVPGTYTTDANGADLTNQSYFWVIDQAFNTVYDSESTTTPTSTVKMTIIISSYDAVTKIVKGTFSGQAWNGAGQIVNITNGKFEATVSF